MSERGAEQMGVEKLGNLIRGWDFSTASRVLEEENGEQRERAGNVGYWREAFNNIFTKIVGRIYAAEAGIEEPLPKGNEKQIMDLTALIIKEARTQRTDEESQKVIVPLMHQLSDLFD